jgi:ribosomal protein S18 acetylase RimI-like enzyme
MNDLANAIHVRAVTSADLDALGAIHRLAFTDSLASALGIGYLRLYYHWFIESPRAVSFVAERDGAIIGFVVGTDNARIYYDELYGARRPAMMRAMILGIVTHPAAILRLARMVGLVREIARRQIARRLKKRPAPSAQNMPPAPPRQNATLVSIAIHPDAQGSGASTPLMRAFVDACAARAVPVIHLSVRADNARAIRFYEREGWTRYRTSGEMAHYEIVL